MKTYLRQAGFSLLELILVIVLLGVLASGAGLLITTPIQAYNDQLRRTQLVDQAELSLRQIARDIRRALPNSIRIQQNVGTGGWALEMANTLDGARYRDEPGGTLPGSTYVSANDILDFSSADTDFNFLGDTNTPAPTPVILTGRRLVIYNTASTNFYTDVTAGGNSGIVTPTGSILTLSQNGIEQHLNINPGFQFTQQSPGQRAFFVDGPISYICDPSVGQTTMVRYNNYAFQSTQPTSASAFAGLPAPSAFQTGSVATQISACSIAYAPGTAQRGGIITLGLTLNDPTGEAITLLHQVHVVNVP